ncbi:Tetrahydroberberine oxidase [Linum perenne]
MNSFLHSTMAGSPFLMLLLLLPFSSPTSAAADQLGKDFLQCLDKASSISHLVYTQTNPSYSSVLQFSIRNPRFNTTSTTKPLVVVTPRSISHIQATIKCSQKYGLQLRVRSGGHDYEGISYTSVDPNSQFIVMDMINLREITVDVESKTAWVQAGATLGELYYAISQKSRTLAFPGGICPTVGIGGYVSGGGYGNLLRKYGLAADNVVDAVFVDAKGRTLDRHSMGEDMFWAIRGGGGNSFGVAVAWKVSLVPVPEKLTVFRVSRTLEQNATKLVHRWQTVANKLPEDIIIMATIQKVNSSIQATFNSMYLGGIDDAVKLIQERFPELGLVKSDCTEMSWIESTIHFARFPRNTPLEILLNRTITLLTGTAKYKGKSDYVEKPIPKFGWEGVWKKLNELGPMAGALVMIPYGGKMGEIPEWSLPFPHRAGNLFMIQYDVFWNEDGIEASERNVNWIREVYSYMTPFVSKNPRAAYVNYRDLDIGMNEIDEGGKGASYKEARVWGLKYFKNNFDRLVKVKTAVDPGNVFRNEQSIPPL